MSSPSMRERTGADLDEVAGDLDLERLLAVAAQRPSASRTCRPAPRILSTAWLSVRPCRALAVDGGDDVAGQDAGARGGRVVDRA